MRSNNKRTQILEAALAVVEDDGANHLTIDAVAAKSGFSKGGVLYHFGSKQVLLTSMLDHLIGTIRARIEANAKQGSTLQALLSMETTPAEKRAFLALVAAGAEDRELLKPARDYIRHLLEQISKEQTATNESLLLFFAHEGLRFFELFDLNPMSEGQVQQFSRHLESEAAQLK